MDAAWRALCCLTLHAWASAACKVCVTASRWQQQPPLASSGVSAASHWRSSGTVCCCRSGVECCFHPFNDVCAKTPSACCASLATESNLSRCGFRGSSHIGIPYSTKVPLLEPRAPKCGLSSGTERSIFEIFAEGKYRLLAVVSGCFFHLLVCKKSLWKQTSSLKPLQSRANLFSPIRGSELVQVLVAPFH